MPRACICDDALIASFSATFVFATVKVPAAALAVKATPSIVTVVAVFAAEAVNSLSLSVLAADVVAATSDIE